MAVNAALIVAFPTTTAVAATINKRSEKTGYEHEIRGSTTLHR